MKFRCHYFDEREGAAIGLNMQQINAGEAGLHQKTVIPGSGKIRRVKAVC